jgi:parallel beta-helix repeat protein
MGKRRTRHAFLALGLSGLLLISPWSNPQEADAVGRFMDDDGSVHEGAIEAIATAGLTQGCNPTGTQFCPNASVTRGQIAAFLARALKLPAAASNPYNDDNGTMFEDAINRLASAGIAQGCGTSSFCPDALATRGEMAVFLSRAFQLGNAATDSFADDAASPYQDHINRLAGAGITKGCSAGLFCPDRYVARGEMASFLARALGLDIPAVAAANPSCQGVQVAAGSDLVTVANSHPGGTTFCLAAGNYDVTATIPAQTGDRWVGNDRRSILSGGDSTAMAFKADGVSNLIISGLVIEHFNTPPGGGLAALKMSSGWIVENSEIRNNATVGIYHESNVQIRGNLIHHNGQYGITGFRATNVVVEGNEVSYNNTRNFDDADQGGAKWTSTTNLIVRDNYFHHNNHTGIWLDSNHVGALIENNQVEDNTYHGIHFEVSCSGTIRGNSVSRNGETGIFVNASQNTEVANNSVANNGDGIRVWAEDRGAGVCKWIAQNVHVHDNSVTMQDGYSGLQRSTGQGMEVFTNGSIRFDNNHYDIPDSGGRFFHWLGSFRTWGEWQSYGQDSGGSIS